MKDGQRFLVSDASLCRLSTSCKQKAQIRPLHPCYVDIMSLSSVLKTP